MSTTKTKILRKLIAGDGLIIAPGAYDGISATLINNAGFSAVYMTGSGTSAALGYPDFGLITLTEMVRKKEKRKGRVDVPVIAD
ncbi:MAG: isocitrate lyase/phosphoenolpyruvate mutase family protein, partial [Proteobacteria bacterium]|nr:isocitrate lyase/phosphoenolpyruvate mutase family protein [Pseudomonadota bacterium]